MEVPPHCSPKSGPVDVVRALRTTGETHVWWWPPPATTDPADLSLLETEEFRRALCLPTESLAAAFVHTRAGARRALAELLGVTAAEIGIGRYPLDRLSRRLPGVPRVLRPDVPLRISLARTVGCGVFAVGTGAGVGVDAEELRPLHARRIADPVLTDSERAHLRSLPEGPLRDAAFHRCWTRKEAVVKAVGVGLTGTELQRLEVCPERAGPVEVSHHHAGRTTHWTVQDLRLTDRHAAAVARPADAAHGPVVLHRPPPPR